MSQKFKAYGYRMGVRISPILVKVPITLITTVCQQ